VKILSEMYLWTVKTLLNLGSYPPLDPDLEFLTILQHFVIGYFSTIWLASHENVSASVSVWARFTLAEACAVRVFILYLRVKMK